MGCVMGRVVTCTLCVHLIRSSNIWWGMWGIFCLRVAMVMSSPLAIISLMCEYACAIVVGGVW
jgi:hypothetical protein